jgi:DNA-binding response OmpR family regulator
VTAAGPARSERKVLVVDDHVDLAENIAEILAGAGHEAVVAASAEEALRLFEAGGIAGVITDFRLPGRNGAQLIAELRRRGSRVPAVVMSAFTDDETIGQARAAGALDVLPKPVDISRLMSAVASLGGDDAMVLLVEDSEELADNLAEALRAGGFLPVVSGTVAEALSARGEPRAAVIDFRLPDGTGLDVARRLRARNPTLRILFMSGYGDDTRARLRGSLDATDWFDQLDKPVKVEHLLAWVATALGDAKTERPGR